MMRLLTLSTAIIAASLYAARAAPIPQPEKRMEMQQRSVIPFEESSPLVSSLQRRSPSFLGDIGDSWNAKFDHYMDVAKHPIRHLKQHFHNEKEQLEQAAQQKEQEAKAKAHAIANPIETAQAKIDAKEKELQKHYEKTVNTITNPEQAAEAAIKKKEAEVSGQFDKYKNAVENPGKTAENWLKPQLMAPN